MDLTYYNEQFPKNIFPTRTDKAHKVARKIAKIMKQLNISGALTVFIHEDKSVSVGISSDNTIDAFKSDVEKLKEGLKAAHKNGELGECTVDTATILIDHLNKENKGDPPKGNCSEPRAACVAHSNPSPIIGYDTV